MSNDDLVKLVIAIASAFIGWLLAQLASVLKAALHQRKVRKLLIEELRDIETEVERVRLFYKRQLQIAGAGGIGNSASTGIANPIYSGYYKDALLSLNQRQRISFQMIHALVGRVNIGLEELMDLTADLQNEHFNNGVTDKIKKGGVAWREKVKAEFTHCASLKWQVGYHLANRKGPDLSPYTESHKAFCQFLEEAEKEADSFIASGRNLDRDRFNLKYDPQAFQVTP